MKILAHCFLLPNFLIISKCAKIFPPHKHTQKKRERDEHKSEITYACVFGMALIQC